MATARGPLLSIAASGSVGKLTFSELAQHRAAVAAARGHSHIIRRKPRRPKTGPTAAQLAQRARIKAAALAWKTLDANTQARWKAKGITVYAASRNGLAFRLLHGYALFMTEWITQNITAPALPLLPA